MSHYPFTEDYISNILPLYYSHHDGFYESRTTETSCNYGGSCFYIALSSKDNSNYSFLIRINASYWKQFVHSDSSDYMYLSFVVPSSNIQLVTGDGHFLPDNSNSAYNDTYLLAYDTLHDAGWRWCSLTEENNFYYFDVIAWFGVFDYQITLSNCAPYNILYNTCCMSAANTSFFANNNYPDYFTDNPNGGPPSGVLRGVTYNPFVGYFYGLSSGSDENGSGTVTPSDDPADDPEELFASDGTLVNFVFAIFQAPMVLLSSMLDFTIFGINLYGVLKVLLTLSLTALLIAAIVKLILHFKS